MGFMGDAADGLDNFFNTAETTLGLTNAAKATAHPQNYGGVPGGATNEASRASAMGAGRGGDFQGYGVAANNQLNQAGNDFADQGRSMAGSADSAAYRAGVTGQNYQQDAATDYGMQQNDRSRSLSALDQLHGFINNGPGPSAAQAQLQQASDHNMASAMALARSGRGAGDNAAAMRNAAFQNAATQQQTGQQAAVLRANEATAWNQQKLGAMGMEQNTLGNMRGQDLGAMGQNQGMGLGYNQLGSTYSGQGNQALLGAGSLASGMYGAGAQANLGYNQLADHQFTSGEANRNDIYKAQLGSDTSIANAQVQSDMQNQTAENQKHKDNIGIVGSVLSGVLSDEREKQNMQPYGDNGGILDPWANVGTTAPKAAPAKESGGGLLGGIFGGGGGGGGMLGGMLSDVRNKKNIEAEPSLRNVFGQPPTGELDAAYARQGADTGPRFDFRPAQGYSYEYKDPHAPGAAPGRQFGPMAQDLERTPAGAAAVKTGPDGKKMVDAGRLTMANTAAISEQQRTIDRLKALLGPPQNSYAPVPYAALDDGYAQQGRFR
jgi:hypothetical protein